MEWYFILTIVLGAIILFLLLLKIYLKLTSGVCKCEFNLQSKTVIVTGANTGIGFEAARDFAKRGARVILACRDLQKATDAQQAIIRETSNLEVIVRIVDFASLKSVRQCAKEILETEFRIHILVNNAGATFLGNRKSEDGLQLGLQVNHFGPFLFTNLLLGRIKESAPGRIIMVSSTLHSSARVNLQDFNMEKSYNGSIVYNNSKLYNIMMANELTKRMPGSAITCNSLHPGFVGTDIFRNMPAVIRYPFAFTFGAYSKSLYEGAQTIIYLAVAPELERVTGEYFVDCKKATTSAKAKDEQLAAAVWDLSEKCVKLQPHERHFEPVRDSFQVAVM